LISPAVRCRFFITFSLLCRSRPGRLGRKGFIPYPIYTCAVRIALKRPVYLNLLNPVRSGVMKPDDKPQTLLRPLATLAKQIGWNPDYLVDQAKSGLLKAQQIGRLWMSTQSEVERFTASSPGPGRPTKGGGRPPPSKDRSRRLQNAQERIANERALAEQKRVKRLPRPEPLVRRCPECNEWFKSFDDVCGECKKRTDPAAIASRKVRIAVESQQLKPCPECGKAFNTCNGTQDRCYSCRSGEK